MVTASLTVIGTSPGSHSSDYTHSFVDYGNVSTNLNYKAVKQHNGTYLWNGHYLREKPSPYPEFPSMANDGLPFGSAQHGGPVGKVGFNPFPDGSPYVKGVNPSSSLGQNTLITTNTTWKNISMTLVGNVSIENGVTLTIINSMLTFKEPSRSNDYSYGFNVSFNGDGTLLIENGSFITQSKPSTTNSWFIWGTGATGGYGIPYSRAPDMENFTVIVNNSKLVAPSSHTPNGSFVIRPGGWYYPARMSGFEVSYFNYSTFLGNGYFNQKESLNVTLPSHDSLFSNAVVNIPNPFNDTFNNTVLGITNEHWATGGGVVSFSHNTVENETNQTVFFENLNPGIMDSTNNHVFDAGPDAVYMNGSRMINIHMGFSTLSIGLHIGFLEARIPTRVIIQNNTFENFLGTGVIIGGGTGSTWAGPIGWHFLNTTGKAVHNTFRNFTTLRINPNQWGGLTLFNMFTGKQKISYNLISGMNSIQGKYGAEPNVLTMNGWSYNISDNLIENFNGRMGHPSYNHDAFWMADHGTQIYMALNGATPGRVVRGANSSLNAQEPENMSRIFTGNYMRNITGQSWFIQARGWHINVTRNVVENVDSSTGLGIAIATGSWDETVKNNSVYGLYNYSLGISSAEGGAYGTLYSGNEIYDVGITSWGMNTMASTETWNRSDGSLLLANNNATAYGILSHEGIGHTTDVTLSDSLFPSIAVSGSSGAEPLGERQILPTDFNISLRNTYVPSAWKQYDGHNGSYWKTPINPFNFGTGKNYNITQRTNPNFLNVSGYLGIFQGQKYDFNLSSFNIVGEGRLPLMFQGNMVASIPKSNYSYTFSVDSPSDYKIGTNSSGASPVTLTFRTLPHSSYYVQEMHNGTVVKNYSYGPGNNTISLTYNPHDMPLNAVFVLHLGHIPVQHSNKRVNSRSADIGMGIAAATAIVIVVVVENKRKRQ